MWRQYHEYKKIIPTLNAEGFPSLSRWGKGMGVSVSNIQWPDEIGNDIHANIVASAILSVTLATGTWTIIWHNRFYSELKHLTVHREFDAVHQAVLQLAGLRMLKMVTVDTKGYYVPTRTLANLITDERNYFTVIKPAQASV